MPTSFQVRAFLGHGSYLPTTQNRYGCRGDRLLLPACQRFIPTPLLRHGVGGVVCTYTHKLSLTARCTPLSTRHLRLLFRVVNAVALHSLLHSALSSIFTFHPPDSGVCPCYHPSAHLFYAHPGPRCEARRCTDSTPATRATAALTSSSLRLTARRGRLIVLVQAHDKEPVVP